MTSSIDSHASDCDKRVGLACDCGWDEDQLRKFWHITGSPQLSFLDRLCLLFGVPLYVRFISPNGECNAACTLEAKVSATEPPAPEGVGRWTRCARG